MSWADDAAFKKFQQAHTSYDRAVATLEVTHVIKRASD